MLKAINALVLVIGTVLLIIGTVASNTILAVVGDVVVVAGVLLYLYLKRTSSPVIPTDQ